MSLFRLINMMYGKRKSECLKRFQASPVVLVVKNLPSNAGDTKDTWVHPLEKGMATHSSILAWKFPWTEEPGRLQYLGPAESGTRWTETKGCEVFSLSLSSCVYEVQYFSVFSSLSLFTAA